MVKSTSRATKYAILSLVLACAAPGIGAKAQSADTMSEKKFKPHGQLWGYAFGDYAYKDHADTVGGGRGGSNQYTKVPAGQSMFQFRRIYLGYNYDLSEKFAAEFLLAAEDNFGGGDLLANGKFAPYVKLANIRWKNIFPGTDLAIGQVFTPAFPMMSEAIWGYRSIERTVSDIRRTPSFDLGATLQGHFIPKNDNFGYNIMVGNGSSSKPESDKFKAFYGDIYAKFFKKRIIVDVYGDYQRLNWQPGFHRDRYMAKGFVAYTTPKLTVGVEAFYNVIRNDDVDTRIAGGKDTVSNTAVAISAFVRGRIYKDKLGFFARYDNFSPSGKVDNAMYNNDVAMTTQYDPNTKEQFITAGIDYTPIKNVHIMPNIWYNSYENVGPHNYGAANSSYDMVYRLTFYYVYGK
jgi:hypothetical protein